MWDIHEDTRVQSSVNQPIPVPADSPATAPLRCIRVSESWIPAMCGVFTQLLQGQADYTTDKSVLRETLSEAMDLTAIGSNTPMCQPVRLLHSSCTLQFSSDAGRS